MNKKFEIKDGILTVNATWLKFCKEKKAYVEFENKLRFISITSLKINVANRGWCIQFFIDIEGYVGGEKHFATIIDLEKSEVCDLLNLFPNEVYFRKEKND